MNKPFVSILVPIYNGANYLRRFLDSALLQSLENIEVICVDDGSTDNSMEILEEYKALYPEKLFIYKATNHNGFSGIVRNEALGYARADYVYMCDQDDVIQIKSMELMYNEAIRYNADLIVGRFLFAFADERDNIYLKNAYMIQTMHANSGTAISNGVEFFARLIKKSLLDTVGPQPIDLLFHDVAYMPVLQSYAENIRFIDWGVYYYYRRNDSISGTQSTKVCVQSIAAERYAIEHCNPKYKEYVEKMVAQRILNNIGLRWICADYFVQWIKELMPVFRENSLITSNATMLKQLEGYANLDNNTLPQRVYICSFDREETAERVFELSEKAFHDGCDVIVLNSENCDIEENEYVSDAFKADRLDLVEGYFAVKSIYENGGVYLNKSVQLVNAFNYCKLFRGFFGFSDTYNFTDKVFGAVSGNKAFKEILATFSYKWDKKKEFMSLADRIKLVLVSAFDIPLNGNTIAFGEDISVFSPEMFVVDTRFGSQSVKCITKVVVDPSIEGNITINEETFKYLLRKRAASPGSKQTNNKRTTPNYRENQLERELNEIKNSNTWKLMLRIRRIGDGPLGPFLKKIFHGMLKIRTKFKGKSQKNNTEH